MVTLASPAPVAASRPPRRSTQVMFASTVLTLEAFVVAFATLAAYGLLNLPKPLILGVGAAIAVSMVLCCAFLKKPAGLVAGWILQVVLVCLGFAVPTMFLVGALFAAAWWYAVVKGRQIDREVAERDRLEDEYERTHSNPSSERQEP